MELENIIKLIKTVSESQLTEFKIEDDDFKLTLKANRGVVYVEQPAAMMPPVTMGMQSVQGIAAQNMQAVQSQPAAMVAAEPTGNVIKAPLVGTFYNAASQDQEPYIAVGMEVKKGQVIGIIEAMKLMNEVECEFDGIVEEILVNNEQVVEYGQPLVVIR